jgi:hypothetical protein
MLDTLRLVLTSAGRLLRLSWQSLWPAAPARRGPALRRALVMVGFLPLFTLVQITHWIGLLLDEILFPGYRRVEIREPLFVLGVPRSGTTHLHRVLARDPQFTTFSTWECLFAPSVTERRLWMGLAWLDDRLGRPLGRILSWLEGRAFSGLETVHRMALGDPEEDYLALMPMLACFILVLPFPSDPYLWRMGTFDRDMPATERKRLMAFYRGCLQRHLYCHGPDKRLLSKNAAFAPLAGSLRETFPDARFLVCLREPVATLPSQLSSVDGGVRLFGSLEAMPRFREQLAAQLGFYYANLERALAQLPVERCAWVTMDTLKVQLRETLRLVYDRLGLQLPVAFDSWLAQESARARGYRSGHRYSLDQFGLTEASLGPGIEQIYARLAERALRPVPRTANHPLPPRSQGRPAPLC